MKSVAKKAWTIFQVVVTIANGVPAIDRIIDPQQLLQAAPAQKLLPPGSSPGAAPNPH
jgi:hypothetical protein